MVFDYASVEPPLAANTSEAGLLCQGVTHKINNYVIMKLTSTDRQQQISLKQTLDTGASVL